MPRELSKGQMRYLESWLLFHGNRQGENKYVKLEASLELSGDTTDSVLRITSSFCGNEADMI